VVENIQRAELTEADEADAYHQLSLIGVSAAAIAKKTGRTKTTVEGVLKAKASNAGAAALGKGYTIDEALIMAEFEGNQDATCTSRPRSGPTENRPPKRTPTPT
jgi:ParB family chromosome partitioning protein